MDRRELIQQVRNGLPILYHRKVLDVRPQVKLLVQMRHQHNRMGLSGFDIGPQLQRRHAIGQVVRLGEQGVFFWCQLLDVDKCQRIHQLGPSVMIQHGDWMWRG
ncbi:hypothetical protein D3C87_1937880 [compost metagenome]